jgi:hypothetical protein
MPMPKKPRTPCLNCGKPANFPAGKYCSNKCQAQYQYKEYIKNWKAGFESGLIAEEFVSNHIRRYLIQKYGERCAECGWHKRSLFTNQVPLSIHHKDGGVWRKLCNL